MLAIASEHKDFSVSADVDYSSMSGTVGPRVVEFLVPDHFPTLHQMAMRTGISYTSLHKWKKGTVEPELNALEKVAQFAEVHVTELLLAAYGRKARPQLDTHPEWISTRDRTIEKYKNKLPKSVFDLAGQTCPAKMPKQLTIEFVYGLAMFWWEYGDEVSVNTELPTEKQR